MAPTYSVILACENGKDSNEFEATLGGENQTAVVEGDRPPQHRSPIPTQFRVVDDGVGVVLDHDTDLGFGIAGPPIRRLVSP